MTEFIWPVRVYYEDTDAGGVVYYANYLKFMERARTEWLRSLGFEQDELREAAGIIFVVRHVDIDFHAPARFNDQLQIHCRMLQRGRVSLTFQQQILRAGDRRPLCAAAVKIACLDVASFRPRPIPKSMLQELSDGI